MVYGLCQGDWSNVQAVGKSSDGTEFPVQEFPGQADNIKVFAANVTGVTAGDYSITLTETLGSRQDAKTTTHTIEYYGNEFNDQIYA